MLRPVFAARLAAVSYSVPGREGLGRGREALMALALDDDVVDVTLAALAALVDVMNLSL